MVARLRLETSRRLAERNPPALAVPEAASLQLANALPLPLFPARRGAVSRDQTGWHFTFLNEMISFDSKIDWSYPPGSAATQLWRMNLHYMEYLEELDEQAGISLMLQWITANPPYRRQFWRDAWNSYTVSLRTLVWMQFLARHGSCSKPIIDSLSRQLLFLERNLERDLGGNHLIKNIKALLWASVFFAGPVAGRWRELGIRLLRQELGRQILPDGMHFERSPSYHLQVFADLIEIRHALGRDPLEGGLDAALQKMAHATELLTHPDGLAAQFNDSGLTMAYSPAQCLAACRSILRLLPTEPDGGFALTAAGYFGFRSAQAYVVIDMGRIGPDDLPAHAHGDIGSFELSLDGQRIIVDPGVFEYIAGPRRDASRAASSHNCLALDDADQAEFYGAFRCGRRPDVDVDFLEIDRERAVVHGRHDGYRILPGRPVIVRRFEADRTSIRIADRVDCPRWHSGRANLLLHPECSAEIAGNSAKITRGQSSIELIASLPVESETASWWPDMGESRDTIRLFLTLPPGSFESSFELRLSGTTTLGDL